MRLHWDIRRGQGQGSLGSQRPALSQTLKDNASDDSIWPTKTLWKDFWQPDIWPSLKPNAYLSAEFFRPRLKLFCRVIIDKTASRCMNDDDDDAQNLSKLTVYCQYFGSRVPFCSPVVRATLKDSRQVLQLDIYDLTKKHNANLKYNGKHSNS